MSSIDLRTDPCGGTWIRRFGDHEAKGFGVSTNDVTAHVTIIALELSFVVDRDDVPAAWEPTIDVPTLRAQLIPAIVRRMSVEILEELFREIRSQRQRAHWEGAREARSKIQEALGL